VLRCRVVPGGKRKLQTWPVVVACVVLCGFVPAKVAADSSGSLRARATELRHENTRLAARSHGTVLELYALDTQLARARSHVVALRIEAAQVRAEQAASERRLTIARRSLKAAQRALELHVQQLYEQGNDDPVAVLLGSTSVGEAFSRLDALGRVSEVDRLVLVQTRDARRRYQSETRALANRQRSLTGLLADAARTESALEQTRAQRAAYLASLAAKRSLNASSIAGLENQAQAVETRASRITPVAPPTGGGTLPPGATLTVSATGYSLRGRTATGVPAGWGVVAVDPSVIPLGTRMTIPGYGEGIAADTGSAVIGNTIDLWFPTATQALAWGRRTVTITLH
jgi:3D (Asp-Asp-Asp) domain-containing protein/peptidoglycan hydrolase CwlO-like protein